MLRSVTTLTARTLSFDRTASFNSTDEESSYESVPQAALNTPVPVRFLAEASRRNYTFRKRKEAPPKELSSLRLRKLQKAATNSNPFENPRICCKKLQCFQQLDRTHALHWYREIMTINREELKTTLLCWYHAGHKCFTFDGNAVCWRFLNKAFGISNDLLSAVRKTKGARAAQSALAQPRSIRYQTLRDSIINFLKLTAETLGDDMPHRSFCNLPMPNKSQVYQLYVQWFHKEDPLRFSKSPPVISTFYAVWNEFVPEVKLMRNIGFEKCAECVFYGEERAKHILNATKLSEIRAASKQHYNAVAADRRGYELRKMQARREPQHFISLVVDGADQSSYGLPHFIRKSKEDRGHKIAVKLVGVLMHGVENELFLFSMVEAFETGANHVIESLHRALQIKKNIIGKLPPTLFVQADNCARENNNRFFLGYLEMLVARGVFVEVHFSCLEVGHTHTDVDQSFSCVHRRLDNHTALSLSEFHDQLRRCYSPPPHVEELERVANFSKQCQVTNALTRATRFSVYRYFRFIRSSNQAEADHYKTKCSVKRHISDEWTELPGASGEGFLKIIPDLLRLPETITKPLPNIREVNLCLRAAEARIRDTSVIEELYGLRDRIYTAQEYRGHWTPQCFELEGDYKQEAERTEMVEYTRDDDSSNPEQSEGQDDRERLRYEIGDFLAVKPEARYKTAFWIAEIIGIPHVDESRVPTALEVRWYTAGVGTDPLNVIYRPGINSGQPWIGSIDVETVMLRFSGLTTRKRLTRETANKLSRMLGVSLSTSRASQC